MQELLPNIVDLEFAGTHYLTLSLYNLKVKDDHGRSYFDNYPRLKSNLEKSSLSHVAHFCLKIECDLV